MMGSVGNTSQGSNLDYFVRNNKAVMDLTEYNTALIEKTLQGVKDTLNEFGLDFDVLHSIGVMAGSPREVAGINANNRLSFSSKYKDKSIDDFKQDNYVIDSSAYGVGTHEAGHAIAVYIQRQMYPKITDLMKSYEGAKLEHEIIKEAKREAGTLTKISEYGNSTKGAKAGEYVAEAVSDYMINRDNANKSSIAIVNALKKRLRGK